jgi:RND superfamily putative drug exporter
VCWLVPIMTFSIIVGVALDYDVFLISRILEYRLEGYEHKTSIACGLHATGGIITAAGVIMAFAFGSLMFSSNPVLYQWSFLLTTAVLLDTFVIRTVVVPIITGLAGRHCWWPRQLPEETICMVEYEDRSEETYNLLRTLEESSEYEPLVGRTPGTP